MLPLVRIALLEEKVLYSRLVKIIVALGMSLVGTAATSAQSGSVYFDQSVESDHVSWTPLYSVYLPAGYNEGERKYPVVYILPGGAGGTHNDWFVHGNAAETLDRMIASGEIPPLIVVSPDPRRTNRPEFNTYYLDDSDGSERWETMFFEDFVPTVEKRYRVLEESGTRAAIGLSMGGYGALIYSRSEEHT